MDLTHISDLNLIEGLAQAVKSERKVTHLILIHILEFESRKLYASEGYSSMMDYLMKRFGYCESSAYRRIQAARLLKEIPEVAEKLETGTLNLSQVTKFQKCLKLEKQKGKEILKNQAKGILEPLAHKNGFKTDQILAKEFDQPIQKIECVKPQKDESVQIQMTLTKEEYANYEKLKSLLSHVCIEGKTSQIFNHLVQKELKAKLGKESPRVESRPKLNLKVEKELQKLNFDQSEAGFDASRDHEGSLQNFIIENQKLNTVSQKLTQRLSSEKVLPGENNCKNNRKTISMNVHRELLKTSNYRCEYRNSKGEVCGSAFQLQKDHDTPVAWGGGNEAENLQMLCRTHNLMMARQMRLC